MSAEVIAYHTEHPAKIFSGDYSADMWDAINKAKSKSDLKRALYLVCCRLQELESKLDDRQLALHNATNLSVSPVKLVKRKKRGSR